jgi:hypothetical protein
MNDQTSPTADGQGPGSSQWRNPFEEPQSAQGLPRVPDLVPGGGNGSGGPGGAGRSLQATLFAWRSDLLTAAVLLAAGGVLGVLSGLAWYRFAPTVWLTLPASAVPQVTANVDQSALLVEPEAKGIASVDGYYFVFTAIVGLLLGVLAFYLARRGPLGGRDSEGNRDGAAVGAWAGVLLGGLAASTLAAALGRWISMPDPLKVLHIIAAGHNFHAPVALHAQGLYLVAPLLGMVLFLALTAAFTKPAPQPWQQAGPPQGYFTADNPYGLQQGGAQGGGGQGQIASPQPNANGRPGADGRPAADGMPGADGRPGADERPGDDGHGPDATPGANSGAPQADTSLG